MRHLYVGRKVNKVNNTIVDKLYVVTDDGIWLTDLLMGRSLLVRHWTISELADHFDEWFDLGTVPDGVRVSEIVKINHTISPI